MSRRLDNLSFSHFQKLAIDALTPEQRTNLLNQAEKYGWSSARLTHERDRLLGKPEKVPLLTFDGKVEKQIETLPATATKKTKAALNQVVADLRHDFETEVERGFIKAYICFNGCPRARAIEQGLTSQGGVAGDFDVALSLQLAEGKEWVFDLIRPMLLADKKPFPPPMPDLFLGHGRSARGGIDDAAREGG